MMREAHPLNRNVIQHSSLLALVPAVVVSTAALWLAAGADRRAIDLAVSPFGWNRVIVVHALASLLLSWAIARALVGWLPGLKSRLTVVLWIAAGGCLAWVTVAAGGFVERALESAGAGYVARLLVRVAWCTGLQVPWCLLGQAAAPQWHWRPASVTTKTTGKMPVPPASHRSSSFSPGHFLALALVVAVALPVSYLEIFAEQQTRIARELWDSFRIERARRVARRLCDLGSTRSFGTPRKLGGGTESAEPVRPQLALAQLESTLEYARSQIKLLQSRDPADEQRRQLAQCLVALDEVPEAEAVLEPLARRDAAAALSMAEIHHAGGQWPSTRRWLEEALRLARPTQPSDAARAEANVAIQSRAYELLALGAGEAGQYEAAERYLLEALERLPARQAFFHHQLGLHYEFLGRPFRTVEHLTRAAELAPRQYGRPEGVLSKILSSGTPIGLFRPASSRYK